MEKFRNLKQSGSKHKAEGGEVDNVYDTVDEKEYSRRVLSRANDDWIEDDNGEGGYYEDGREIFDDDDQQPADSKESKKKSNKRTRDAEKKEVVKGKSSIKNMFSKVTAKRKEGNANISEDNVLAEILGELKDTPEIKPKAVALVAKPKKVAPSATPLSKGLDMLSSVSEKSKNATDKEIIDTILKPEEVAVPNKVTLPSKPAIEEVIPTPAVEDTNQEEILPPDHIDMDYSILDDKENQFDETVPEPETTPIDPKAVVIDENITDNWEKLCQMESEADNELFNEIDDFESSPENEIKMWLWDAWEDPAKRPGEIFLFGKVKDGKDFKSLTVHVENVDRCLFLLPRKFRTGTSEEVSMLDVHEEFSNLIVSKLDIDEFRSRKVSKNFSFTVPGLTVPQYSDYMHVEYEGKKPAPENHGKYRTIAHIFGTTNTSLETFLLERKIKGPCWVTIKDFVVRDRPLSWCQKEITCSSAKSIKVAAERSQGPPPVVMLTLNVRVAMNAHMKNEVIMISGLVHTRFPVDKAAPSPPFQRHFCYFTKPTGTNWPFDINPKLTTSKTTAQKFNTERELLSFFLNQYQSMDPDLLVAHDSEDCQLNIICDRIATLKIPMWSRIGRLRMANVTGRNFFCGRMVCDVKKSAEELIKSRSYDLGSLCQQVLKMSPGDHVEINHDQLVHMFQSSEEIIKLISVTMLDTSYVLRLMCELNVLPLALQITNICGNLMSRTLQGGRSKRNEYLLLHAFNEKNYIVPDRQVQDLSRFDANHDATKTKKKAAYSGGLVLEPIKGFYDKFILLMDFNSLYPSIIQEYNICYTTIDTPATENEEVTLPDPSVEQGVLPFQIRRLVESRREVKKLMANADLEADQKMQYNIRQLALKLTANSMYGCLGFDKSRFYAPHLAALVTQKGRDILMNTKALVQKLNLEVIYGDTDSIMVNTNCKDYEQVFKVGHDIKQVVNKIYKHVELDIDGVFKYLLLLKKKKYAAVTMSKSKTGELQFQQEHKGLDIVRRDWSQISVMAGRAILDELLSDRQIDEKIENVHAKLEKFRTNIEKGTTSLNMLAITKQLTKQPKEYPNAKSLPHVQVALRMNATMNKRFKRGDMVDYIICLDGTDNQAMQRAYHIDEIKANDKLKIDTEYYLAQQIHPVVSRLIEPIEGTDAARIAMCLGLDASKFKAAVKRWIFCFISWHLVNLFCLSIPSGVKQWSRPSSSKTPICTATATSSRSSVCPARRTMSSRVPLKLSTESWSVYCRVVRILNVLQVLWITEDC